MQKLGHIALIAKDVEALKKFYETLLGFSFEFETDDKLYAQYSVRQTDDKFDLEHVSLLQADIPNSVHKGFFLRCETDDLETLQIKAVELGGKIVRKPIVQPYGKTEMFLEDPEGNLIQVYKNN